MQARAGLIRQEALPAVVRRNAALTLARLGSADLAHRAVLLDALADPDLSVRAACRWVLHQMSIDTSDAR